jgi:polyhydroxyalkanoate synthase subunit PhaC
MADQPGAASDFPDPAELSKTLASIAERSQRIVSDFLKHQSEHGFGMADPLNVGAAFMEMTTRLMTDPAKLWQSQMNLWQAHMDLWQSAARRLMGEDTAPAASPAADDRRFKDAAWEENQLFDYIKQSYLLTAR